MKSECPSLIAGVWRLVTFEDFKIDAFRAQSLCERKTPIIK